MQSQASRYKTMSTPGSQLPPEYDDYHPRDYDPNFTADISTKMRIPDRIGVVHAFTDDRTVDNLNKENQARDDLHRSATMNVPDRIVIFDHEEEAGKTPNLHKDIVTDTYMRPKPINMSAPPRTIRVDEHEFSYTEDEEPGLKEPEQEEVLANGGLVAHSDSTGLEEAALRVSPGRPLLISDDDEDQMDSIRKQVDKLTLHVFRLEEENAKRKQHELVLSSIVVGYFMLQMAKWFLSSK